VPRSTLNLRTIGFSLLIGTCMALSTAVLTPGSAGASTGSRISDPQYGMSFTLPNEWNQVSLDGSDVGALLGTASKEDPSLNAALTAEATSFAEKGLKFFAVSPGDAANVNVGIFKGAAVPVGQLDAEVKLTIASFGGKNIHAKEIHHSYGWTVAGTYTLPLANGTVYGTQVYASHDGRTYVVTFSGRAKSLEAGAASSMMRSWRFT
jgi:hypothetical protein